jgi:hypothetical protein
MALLIPRLPRNIVFTATRQWYYFIPGLISETYVDLLCAIPELALQSDKLNFKTSTNQISPSAYILVAKVINAHILLNNYLASWGKVESWSAVKLYSVYKYAVA